MLVGTCRRPHAAMVALVTKPQLLRMDLCVRIRAMGRLPMRMARVRQANHRLPAGHHISHLMGQAPIGTMALCKRSHRSRVARAAVGPLILAKVPAGHLQLHAP